MAGPVRNELDTEVAAGVKPVPLHYLLRRIHSFVGVMPLSLYLIIHLAVGSMAVSGRDAYDAVQAAINRIPLLVAFEVIVIMLPLAFHAVYGLTIAVRSRNNPFTYPYLDNWRYTLQRYTGYVLAVFVLIHIYFLWQYVRFTSEGRAAFGSSPYDVVRWYLQDSNFMVIYVIGVAAAAFHCANGLWGFCVSWGIAATERAQRAAGWGAWVVFFVLAYLGFRAVNAFYVG
jgi:succinate dehydrogenase / fumarate reductase cytochrome b subunit